MATATRRAPKSGPQLLSAGPWPGVLDTDDPYDSGPPNPLVDALNMYLPDPARDSGVYARPGFDVMAGPLVTQSTPFRGQAVYAHTAADGTITNLIFMAGKVFRGDVTLSIWTDVTPASGVTIDAGVTARVKCLTVSGSLVVSDGVNPVWIASNLASTPITGTNINYDGAGVSWSARDITQFGGSLIVLLNTLNSVALSSTIAWAEPGFPTIGYTQTGFSNFWAVQQVSDDPIYAIHGTELYLYLFRQRSIGAINGAIGPDLQSTKTTDAIAFNEGTLSPQCVLEFGDKLFFVDALSRPQMMTVGSAPEPIWKAFRSVVQDSSFNAQNANQTCAVAAFESSLNMVIFGPWSPEPANLAQPTELYWFNAETGGYNGRLWLGGDSTGGISIDAMGTLIDSQGHNTLVVLGSASRGGVNGYAWSFNGLLGQVAFLTTEVSQGADFLVTEASQGSAMLTTEGQTTSIWEDNGQVPVIEATTERMGYSELGVWNTDRATVIATSNAPVTLSVTTPNQPRTVVGTATPAASNDGTFRSVFGVEAQGRGIQVTVSPTTADAQFSLQRVDVLAVPSLAGPEDP